MAAVNGLPPQDPSVPPPPPAEPAPHPTGPAPDHAGLHHDGLHHTGPIMVPPQPPSTAPSPLGLAVAGVGLAMLCVSILVPRVKVEDPEHIFGIFSYTGMYGPGSYGIDTATVVMSLALLAAVGASAHRNPALRWPSRLAAVGFAALAAAFSYHPVTVMRQYLESFDGVEDDFGADAGAVDAITVSADNGVYIAVVGVALLALSTFLMQVRKPPVYAPPPPPAPAGWPGAEPTVTVHPG
ncbi:hypothetical protein SAMN05216298_1193 [Glycomyces sambucus]|uniref:Uncharacterized protein n=1 Tax=Glycomyces sambucus TaxID=380244 RepID=A0A1G9DZ39_9ACTN|nr:hypothetical protein SAMN05216298_1193 [Glycomyces sambucus]